ncbi:hypothetical protein [Streptomyces mangrovisoli]|uniref:Secreted protein n=1 Tax=Streptomyces mangrovisoli TaxID=1428628 RepID=A0A1J4P2R6_9ACTN|nr:hypothetical protein [Streptomyces mangrovisoli]OIJ68864.1 hypothetical protein WN71_005215 [Streptomyces mangrovisoli]
MSAFIQQLPALIGVVIGALGSYLAIVRGDRARFDRERVVRWEEQRYTVYVDWARALKQTITLNYRVAAHLGNDPHPHPLSAEDAEPLMTQAQIDRDPYGEALILLGSPAVVDRAQEWVSTVMAMEAFLREARRDPEGWQALLDRQRTGRQRYYAAVREDLSLPTGHSGRWPAAPTG